jgi:hypothetical protein
VGSGFSLPAQFFLYSKAEHNEVLKNKHTFTYRLWVPYFTGGQALQHGEQVSLPEAVASVR